MSVSKEIISNKQQCLQSLSEALPDITEHVLKLIAEFVPYGECTAFEIPVQKKFIAMWL